MKKNKCEKFGFEHAWVDTTPNVVYPTNPPQYPDREETCKNCGLKRWFRSKTEEWIEYSDKKEYPETYDYEGNITWANDNGCTVGGDYRVVIDKLPKKSDK